MIERKTPLAFAFGSDAHKGMQTEVEETQIKAARELLRWDQKRLSREANVSLASVRRAELGADVTKPVNDGILAALKAAGVVFLGPMKVGRQAIVTGVGLTRKAHPEPPPPPRVYVYKKAAGRPKGIEEKRPRKPKATADL